VTYKKGQKYRVATKTNDGEISVVIEDVVFWWLFATNRRRARCECQSIKLLGLL